MITYILEHHCFYLLLRFGSDWIDGSGGVDSKRILRQKGKSKMATKSCDLGPRRATYLLGHPIYYPHTKFQPDLTYRSGGVDDYLFSDIDRLFDN